MQQKKSRQRSGERHRNAIRERLAANIAVLRDTTSMPKGASALARQLLAVVANCRSLSKEDALLGATAAALLTAHACGMSRSEFVAWLRRTASMLGRKPRACAEQR